MRTKLLALCLLVPVAALASVPEWVRTAAREPLPAYGPETKAVVLLHEQITTVKSETDIRTVTRYVYKVLRPEGRDVATVTVPFDSETSINWVKAWSISPRTGDYELKEKEAIETVAFNGEMYSDLRYKHFQLPGVEPGSIVAYEVDHRKRKNLLQDLWDFQETFPVRHARYVLELPDNWNYQAHWRNHPETVPTVIGGHRWSWQVDDLPEIRSERAMPGWRVLAGQLGLTFVPSPSSPQTWNDVGRWYAQLAEGRTALSPELRNKASELASAGTPPLDAARAFAGFVQREIRYVAVEIGIGGYQPHSAAEVLANRYGDCKDKVTVLKALLRSAGIESYYVLVHSERGFVDGGFPSLLNFNHVVIAIRLPAETRFDKSYAIRDFEGGKMLFFDPTSEFDAFGSLPDELQGNPGLLVTAAGGELIELPSANENINRVQRRAKLMLSEAGELSGDVSEAWGGAMAAAGRARFLPAALSERQRDLENYVNRFGVPLRLSGASFDDLETVDRELVVHLKISSGSFAQATPPFYLFRPAAVGSMSSTVAEGEKRSYPVDLGPVSTATDDVEFTLPSNYVPDDLPPAVHLTYRFAEYSSSVEVKGRTLYFSRKRTIHERRVTLADFDDLKTFYRRIAEDEQAVAVLKRSTK